MEKYSGGKLYHSCDNLVCRARVSLKKRRWEEVEATEVSAGGMVFTGENFYELDQKLHIELSIYNMLSEFIIKAVGVIVMEDNYKAGFRYIVEFVDLDKHQRIQLDEIIRSRVSLNDKQGPNFQAGRKGSK